MAEGEQRPGATEDIFRRANVALQETYRGIVPELGRQDESPFICECASTRCTAVIQLTLEKFEQIREHPSRFVVVPGHAVTGFTSVIEETDRFAVLERDVAAEPMAELY